MAKTFCKVTSWAVGIAGGPCLSQHYFPVPLGSKVLLLMSSLAVHPALGSEQVTNEALAYLSSVLVSQIQPVQDDNLKNEAG